MTIAYYISGHGFGHANRAIPVMRELPPDVELQIVSLAPAWFFEEELNRPCLLRAEAFDCGAIQSDSLTVDRRKTLETYEMIARINAGRLESEAEWLRAAGARLVVCDAPAFPLAAARRAGIPCACVANFTWVDVYRPYLRDFPQFTRMVDELEEHYRMADLALVTPLNTPMPYWPRRRETPLIARVGQWRREEIAQSLGINPSGRWILFYPGHFGLELDWAALDALPETTVFVHAPPPPGLRNVINMRGRGRAFSHADVLASSDAVVAKPGYGIVGECMANAIPMLYTSREDFAEYEVLDAALQKWGGAFRLSQGDFVSGHWTDALDGLARRRPLIKTPANGAAVAAQTLMEMMQDSERRPPPEPRPNTPPSF